MATKVTFHSDTKIIQIDLAPVDGVVNIDVKIDLYSDGKEDWKDDALLSKFLFPITAVGGNPLPGSKSLGSTFFLEYGWQIRPYEATHQLQINGNLYTRDGSNPYLPTSGTYNVQIINQVSSLVDSTVQQLPEIEYASFGGGVWYDETATESGTAYPYGTPQQPVNNPYDAFTIASERGFNTGYIMEDMNVPTDLPLTNFSFVGSGKDRTTISIPDAATVSSCSFEDAEVTGYLDGDNTLRNCSVNDLNYIKGYVEQCILNGTISLVGSDTAHFLDCWSGVPGTSTPTIDCGGSGQALAIRGYNGGIKLINKTGPESISIDLSSGQIILEMSTLTNGTIVCRGVGKVVDSITGNHLHSGTYGNLELLNEVINISEIVDQTTNAVWDEPIADHVITGSFGELISLIDVDITNILAVVTETRKYSKNRTKIDHSAYTLTIYDDNGSTPLKVFNLKDASGVSSYTEIFERLPA